MLFPYSYLGWASSGFSQWLLVIFNISKIITISSFLKNFKKFILIGLIFVIISILIMAIPTAISFNIQYGNCVILFWSQVSNNPILLFSGFIFLFALFLYFLSSFVLLPISGLTMAIKVIRIRENSRKLIRDYNKQNRPKMTDIRLLISQILVSNFAVIFNLPMAIISVLNIGKMAARFK